VEEHLVRGAGIGAAEEGRLAEGEEASGPTGGDGDLVGGDYLIDTDVVGERREIDGALG
jgi:hypothetical protein